ncbi:MAG: hypothetical protein LN561_03050 [Rickettsia endosymbiont of Labidopullus appendiculatus]|nr:hypothetical protein [Rickettsia endosymbiont of Labidopullus appendiculatus]
MVGTPKPQVISTPVPLVVLEDVVPGIPPPPPPPPPPAFTTPLDPLVARGKEKKPVNQAVVEPVEDMVSELKRKLEARVVKAGEVEFKPDSPKHLKEFAKFDKLRKDEIARQVRQEEIDDRKIAGALKAETEKQAASAKVPPKVELNKEGGVPIPPPPPPMPATAGVQLSKPVVNKPPAAGAKVQVKPVQFAVDKDALMEAVKGLRKLSADSTPIKPTEKPVANVKSHLKPRGSNSR